MNYTGQIIIPQADSSIVMRSLQNQIKQHKKLGFYN